MQRGDEVAAQREALPGDQCGAHRSTGWGAVVALFAAHTPPPNIPPTATGDNRIGGDVLHVALA